MSNTKGPFWNRKTLMLVTGASQGIGQHWAVEFSKKLAKDSLILLWARSAKGLEATKAKVLQANPSVKVQIHSIDLGSAKGSDYVQYLSQFSSSQFELYFLVNNAGSIGDVKKYTAEMSDEAEWKDYLNLNVVSFISLTSSFVARFLTSSNTEATQFPEVGILNVTSLAAIQPLPSLGFYCVGKASRESYLKVLAAEYPKLNVLSYSPGPIHTDMVETILTQTRSPELRSGYTAMRDGVDGNQFVTIEASTEKVIVALQERSYVSGGRIDFYDTD